MVRNSNMIPDTTKRTEAALKRHVATIMAGDADSVMRNFADDAVVYTSEGPSTDRTPSERISSHSLTALQRG